MNIQIFGKSKCFDTKKAERWFKERRIRVQMVDIVKYPMSMGELKSVVSAVGLENVIDTQSKDYAQSMLPYMSGAQSKMEYLLENQKLLKTPIVRDGRRAVVGFHPEIWQNWQ